MAGQGARHYEVNRKSVDLVSIHEDDTTPFHPLLYRWVDGLPDLAACAEHDVNELSVQAGVIGFTAAFFLSWDLYDDVTFLSLFLIIAYAAYGVSSLYILHVYQMYEILIALVVGAFVGVIWALLACYVIVPMFDSPVMQKTRMRLRIEGDDFMGNSTSGKPRVRSFVQSNQS